MKASILAAALVLTSFNAFAADTVTREQTIIAHPVTQSTLTLLNAVSGNTCKAPGEGDIQWGCLGALPSDLKKPTIVGLGCFFKVTIQCGRGISADISGMQQAFEVLGPKNAVYDQVNVGVVVSDVKLTGLKN